MSESVAQSIRSQREQELLALREKGLAKSRKGNIKDFSSPMTTPEQAQRFLATMRDKSKAKEEVDHRVGSNVSTDGVNAWYMMQRQREQELRKRRQEAAALLRGYRAPYTGFNRGGSGRGRPSFGDVLSESLDDPSGYDMPITSRRQSTMPRLENNSSSWETFDDENRNPANDDPLDRESQALFSGGKRSGVPRHSMGVYSIQNRSSLLSPEEKHRAIHGPPKHIDTSESKRRLLSASREHYDLPPLGNPAKPPQEPVRETVWRDFVSSEPGSRFPPEAGRYHIYASYACPGSHRALIVRALKGLEDVVSVTIVHPTWRQTNQADPDDRHRGWVFGDPDGKPFHNTAGRGGPFPAAYPGNEPDPVMNAFSIRDLYEYAHDTSKKFTIPLLWDKKLNTIVNNESSDIAYMLNSRFNDYAQNPDLDLYTEDDEDGMDKLNEVSEWLYPMMIHGVYRCGFAKTQAAYDSAIDELTEAFDMADEILQNQRYLTGDVITDADIRLFVTLLRFDEVYAFYFRANTRLVMLSPALLDFCREIYQMPGVAETCDMDQIKAHFFGSHAEWNKYSVVPRGLGFMKLLEVPHSRDTIS